MNESYCIYENNCSFSMFIAFFTIIHNIFSKQILLKDYFIGLMKDGKMY